jgi:hypothetical protein
MFIAFKLKLPWKGLGGLKSRTNKKKDLLFVHNKIIMVSIGPVRPMSGSCLLCPLCLYILWTAQKWQWIPKEEFLGLKLNPSRWWYNDKSLELRDLFFLWSQIQALWLLIWRPLEAYMVVNFRARGINRGARKLTRNPR